MSATQVLTTDQRTRSPITVVVVDDTPDMRLLLRVALRRQPAFEVVGEAGDGLSAIELIRVLQPDAVLLDLAMPIMDGLQALPRIREVSPHTVVIALSGFQASQMGSAALAAGAAAYVQKGASPQRIVDTIAGCLGVDVGDSSRAPETAAVPVVRPTALPDVTAPTRRHRSSHEALTDYHLLVERAVDHALLALDPQGLVRSWNAGAERLTGYQVDDVYGRHFSLLYPPEARQVRAPQDLIDVARTSGRAAHSVWLTGRDGLRVWAEVTLTALDSVDGASGFGLAVRDRTEERRLDEAQASLFAAVSHDLRAPINSIRAFASLLEHVDAEERAQFAQRIDANAEQLQRLVDGLFDYAKIRAGAVDISLEPIELMPLARHCVENMSLALQPFAVVIDESDVTAMADRAALRRVLDNLLSNASKYSPAGTRITIRFARSGDRVQLSVTDQGRGIDPHDQPTIFGEFVRGRLAEDDGGTGLGLASVRQLVALQGGTVQLQSEPGVGTTVTVDLACA